MGEASSCKTSKRRLRYEPSISLGCATARDRSHELVCGGVGVDRTCRHALDELVATGQRIVDGAAQPIEHMLAHRGFRTATAADAGGAIEGGALLLGRARATLAMALARLG